MNNRLVFGLLVVLFGAGCATSGGSPAGNSETETAGRWSDSQCWNTRTLAEREHGNPDRQDQARRDYKNHCQ